MKAPERARRSTACPIRTTKTQQRPKPAKASKRGRFETLVLRYYSGVYNVASRLTDDPVEAVVLTHGAFISARRQLRSRRDEVEIVTILLTAVIRAAGIAKLEEANRTTRVHANKSVAEWNRAERQACSPRCPVCLAGGKSWSGETTRDESKHRGDHGQSSTFSRVGGSLPGGINHS
jgi:hypothetical protein